MIPAAGMGQRLGCHGPKALIDLAGQPMIVRTLERFASLGLSGEALVILPPGAEGLFGAALGEEHAGFALRFVEGGEERQVSVENGLQALDEDTEVVVVHDAARPFVAPESVRASMEAAGACGAATVAIPAIDTILQGDAGGYLESTPDRRRMWACQTPQTFRVEVIREAHRRAKEEDFLGTDDASLVRRCGGRVKLVEGTVHNLKVTTPADLRLAETMIREGLV